MLMIGKIEGRNKRWVAEDELVRYLHRLSGHEFEPTPGDSKKTEESVVLQAMGSQIWT